MAADAQFRLSAVITKPALLYAAERLGLDREIVDYIKESNDLLMTARGQPLFLLKAKFEGDLTRRAVITSWDTTTPQYKKRIWSSGINHPDIRRYVNNGVGNIFVRSDEVLLTRVWNLDALQADTQFLVQIGIDKSVTLIFNTGFNASLHTIDYQYYTMCHCVDIEKAVPKTNCPICYGTMFEGGFDQYLTSATGDYPANTILVSFPMVTEDLVYTESGTQRQLTRRNWVTHSTPLAETDLLISGVGNEIPARFEVLSIEESELRGILLHRVFTYRLLEEDDIRYQVPVR